MCIRLLYQIKSHWTTLTKFWLGDILSNTLIQRLGINWTKLTKICMRDTNCVRRKLLSDKVYCKKDVVARSLPLSLDCSFIVPLILCMMRQMPVNKHQVSKFKANFIIGLQVNVFEGGRGCSTASLLKV